MKLFKFILFSILILCCRNLDAQSRNEYVIKKTITYQNSKVETTTETLNMSFDDIAKSIKIGTQEFFILNELETKSKYNSMVQSTIFKCEYLENDVRKPVDIYFPEGKQEQENCMLFIILKYDDNHKVEHFVCK